jgi:CRISPR/Cas system-associated protein endoribonuclease Cas2
MMNNQIKSQLCKDDFYDMMQSAVESAGGCIDVEIFKKKTVEEFVNVLANNGIRVVYIPEKHIDELQIVWGKSNSNSNSKKSAPTKRQLLFDSMDKSSNYEDPWSKDGSDV